MKARWCVTALLLLACAASGADRPDLSGRVVGPDGTPVGGATAYVYTAGPKAGPNVVCPSCYPDCGKTAVTDADGRFTIRALDPALLFRVLFVAEGHRPAFVTKVDPDGVPVEAKLERMPKELDPALTLKGRVIDPEGQPVVGAIVTPAGCKTPNRRWWGTLPGVDPMSITNARGEFLITSAEPAEGLDLKVEARGLAPKQFPLVVPGATPHELKLTRGATVVGRLVRDGKPLAGIEIGLIQRDRRIEGFTGSRSISTDSDGRFTFTNIAPAGQWAVFGKMESLGSRGSLPDWTVAVGGDDTTCTVGDVAVGKAYTVSGRVETADGGPVPEGATVFIEAEHGSDALRATVADDGSFVLNGVPPGQVSVSVGLPGYHLSRANRSVEPLGLRDLEGKVDGNLTGLVIRIEAGEVKLPGADEVDALSERFERVRYRRLAGVPAQ